MTEAELVEAARGFARHLVAARIAAVVDGTTEMQNERIGAALATRYAASRHSGGPSA